MDSVLLIGINLESVLDLSLIGIYMDSVLDFKGIYYESVKIWKEFITKYD